MREQKSGRWMRDRRQDQSLDATQKDGELDEIVVIKYPDARTHVPSGMEDWN